MTSFMGHSDLNTRHALLSLVCLAGLSALSCSGLRVDVGDTIPVSFTFHAGRFAECCTELSQFIVFEEGSEQPLWKITVSRGPLSRSEVRLLSIQYANLPEGFFQEIPAAGRPPSLAEGKTYEAVAGAPSYVPWARTRFRIQAGKIVELNVNQRDLP